MMETKLEYYFKKIKEFPLPEIFAVKDVCNIHKKKTELLEKLCKNEAVVIDKSTKVKEGVVIEGPVWIGKNCVIGPHAFIRKGTIIGDNCEIGRIEIKGSVIMNNVKAHHHGYIGDSVIGDGVNVGAGVVFTNFKLHGADIVVEGKNIGRKFGAIVGDNTSIGCNTVTAPGTFIGPDVWIYSLCSLNGFIPKNSIVKHKPVHEVVDKQLG